MPQWHTANASTNHNAPHLQLSLEGSIIADGRMRPLFFLRFDLDLFGH